MIGFSTISFLLYVFLWLFFPTVSAEEGKKVFESKAAFSKAWSPLLTAKELEMFEPINQKGDGKFQNFRFSGQNSLRGLKCDSPVIFSVLSINGNLVSSYDEANNLPMCRFQGWALTSGVWTKDMKIELVGIIDKKISDTPLAIRAKNEINHIGAFEKVGLKNVKFYSDRELSPIIRENVIWDGIHMNAGATVYFGGGEDGNPTYIYLLPYDKKRTVKIESAECREVHRYKAPYIACMLAKDLKLKSITVPTGSIVLYAIPNKTKNPEPAYALKLTEDVPFKGEVFKKGTSVQIQKGQVSIGYPLDDEYKTTSKPD